MKYLLSYGFSCTAVHAHGKKSCVWILLLVRFANQKKAADEMSADSVSHFFSFVPFSTLSVDIFLCAFLYLCAFVLYFFPEFNSICLLRPFRMQLYMVILGIGWLRFFLLLLPFGHHCNTLYAQAILFWGQNDFLIKRNSSEENILRCQFSLSYHSI